MVVVVGDANVVLVKDFYARTVVFYFAIYVVGCVISFHNMLIFNNFHGNTPYRAQVVRAARPQMKTYAPHESSPQGRR